VGFARGDARGGGDFQLQCRQAELLEGLEGLGVSSRGDDMAAWESEV
jgi:hypothetical protein